MAEDKLYSQDLIDLLVKKHGFDRKTARTFIKEFVALIEEGLEKDRIVKIKGLGVFKLVEVKSRESVNVATGERFEIQGHNKVSFTPEASLRDLINKPFAHFETIILKDGVDFSEEEEIEIETSDYESEPSLNEEVEDIEEVTEIEGEKEEEEELVQEQEEEKAIIIEEEEKIVEIAQEEEEEEKEDDPEIIIIAAAAEEEEEGEGEEKESETEIEAETEVEIPVIEETESTKPTKKEEKLPLEEIIARELRETNRFFNKSINGKVPKEEKENNNSSVKPSKTFIIVTTIAAIVICGLAVLFTYFPTIMDDVFGYKKNRNEVTEATQTPLPSPTTAIIDSIETIIKEMEDSIPLREILKDNSIVAIAPEEEKEIEVEVPPVKQPEPVEKRETPAQQPVQKTIEEPVKTIAKTEPTTIYRDDITPVRTDSTSYNIVGTKTSHTIQPGETLTRVSLRFYGTKDLWPYLVMHNRKAIPNPQMVPAGVTIQIPELEKK